jgi:beta-glucanase (GH16 family)
VVLGGFTLLLSRSSLLRTHNFSRYRRPGAGRQSCAFESLESRSLFSAAAPLATVVDRHVFYNNGIYDGQRAAAEAADDDAIAPDKTALLPGERMSLANYTSYSRGLNGIMVDVAGLPAGATITAEDLDFRVGNSADPADWDAAPAPSSVTVRDISGPDAPDGQAVSRISVTWSSRAINNTWLQVTVAANADTGLGKPDVFYFGNLMGETGGASTSGAIVTPADVALVRQNLSRPAAIGGTLDFDRDGRVGRSDVWVVRSNVGKALFSGTAFPAGASATPDSDPTPDPVPDPDPTTDPDPVDPGAPMPPVAGNWHSIFSDEFDGSTLAPVWHRAQYWDREVTVVGKGELQAYAPSGVSVSGGKLHLTAREDDRYGVPYTSGLVMTGGNDSDSNEPRFSFLYGYMEVRAKLPTDQGMFPAIWMMPASYNDGNGELDVVEVVGSTPREANFSLHRRGAGDTEDWTGPDFSEAFHTFGVDWQPDHVAWYVDGVERARITDQSLICPEAMYPILNLAIGGDWGGPPDANTVFPATMDVDYVRVWQSGRAAS